jgi:hypothetical protein
VIGEANPTQIRAEYKYEKPYYGPYTVQKSNDNDTVQKEIKNVAVHTTSENIFLILDVLH